MAEKRKKVRLLVYIVVGICLVPLAYLGRGLYYGAKTIHELLAENKHLKQAITNLTREEQIGYAKVIAQETINSPEPLRFLNRKHVWSNNSSSNTLLTALSAFISRWPVLTTTAPAQLLLFEWPNIVICG